MNSASRVCDRFLFEGTAFLFRVSIAILLLFKSRIKRGKFEDIVRLLTGHPSEQKAWEMEITETALFRSLKDVCLSATVVRDLKTINAHTVG